MIYYRMAWRDHQTSPWIWKTTALTSLQAILQLLKSYRAVPQDRIRVFTAASKEELNEMLRRENSHLVSGSTTAAQFLQDRKLQVPGQAHSASASSTTEPVVRQATPVATSSPLREQSASTGVTHFSSPNALESKRLEIESGPAGDHDVPYRFALPTSPSQWLAWIRLQTRLQAGEFHP